MMSDLEKISKHLTPRPAFQGQIHVDSLRVPSSYPPDLLSSSPQLIREDLQRHRTNLIPLIIRPVEEGEYEVIFGKEIVEFARELGINHLFASRIELQDEDVLPFQKRLKSIFGMNQKASSSYSQMLLQSTFMDQIAQLVRILIEENKMTFKNQFDKLENKLDEQNNSLQKISQELDELKKRLSLRELQQPISRQTMTEKPVSINRYRNPQNLTKRVPNLKNKEAEIIIQQIQEGRRFKSVDELKAIAPSSRWDELNIQF